jgi:niacin transporter
MSKTNSSAETKKGRKISMKQNTNKVLSMTIAAMLCAIGIVIPMFAPKIVLPPVSFTLASHVPIFIAMFISPPIAIAVSIITTIGFFFSGTPIVIVIRAATHVIFAIVGALVLKKNGNILLTVKGSTGFALLIAVIHAVAEVIAVTLFFMATGSINNTYLTTVIVGVGLGTIIHSSIDFAIALLVWKPLQYIIMIPASAKVSVK